jgi:hypothetical protein
MSGKLLKLKAKDAEDLQVISTVLQDAIVPVCDMIYRPEEKDFVMVAQRFCCEGKERAATTGCFERICSALHIKGVEAAQLQGIDLAKTDAMLDLLAVMPEGKVLQLIFAGGGKIRLQLGDWVVILEDFGEPWPTTQQPQHVA